VMPLRKRSIRAVDDPGKHVHGREDTVVECESACDLTPRNRLPTATLIGHTINSSIQCVAMRGLGSDLDADRAPDPTPNNSGMLFALGLFGMSTGIFRTMAFRSLASDWPLFAK
jgi:hypothetical protein